MFISFTDISNLLYHTYIYHFLFSKPSWMSCLTSLQLWTPLPRHLYCAAVLQGVSHIWWMRNDVISASGPQVLNKHSFHNHLIKSQMTTSSAMHSWDHSCSCISQFPLHLSMWWICVICVYNRCFKPHFEYSFTLVSFHPCPEKCKSLWHCSFSDWFFCKLKDINIV